MSADRMDQIGELLEEVLALATTSRAAYLDRTCAGDPELRAEDESLLASHEQAASRFLNEPWRDASSSRNGSTRRIGPYLLTSRLGVGGMGEVFAAVRADGQFEQTVALKLVRAGYAHAGDVVARFRSE